VINRDSKTLIIKKETDDFRNRGIEIQIDSTGFFEYKLVFQQVEAYELIFKDELDKGAWKPILFFPDNDTIEFRLYSMDMADSNKITGSKLSLEDINYNHILKDNFYGKYVYWSQKMDSLERINELSSDYATEVTDSINEITKAVQQFEFRYIINSENLYGYNQFIGLLRSEKDLRRFSLDSLEKYHAFFQQKFPDHPYNEISQFRLNGLKNIIVGGYYVDFSAPDSTGKEISISNYIAQNKYTLLDLWAPWCSPCIYKSQKILPIYEQYKESGFAVIAVVGGIRNHEQYIQAIDKYKYPWIVLSEIDDKNLLWEKYSVSQGGGGQFLLDNKGKILAINPLPDELEKIIME
jgi:thiol-disulfide isomerase/thioredoxin